MHKFTDEEKAYLKEIIPGKKYVEIAQLATEKFGWNMTLEQVKGFCARYHITTGLTGCFPKGNEPHNKGKKGVYYKGCEKTWFKKGNVPPQHRPVGSETIRKDGWVFVKVAEPNICREKHRVVWEQAYGDIPKDAIITFVDNNKTNCNLNNLIMLSRRAHAVMCKRGFYKYTDDARITAILIVYYMLVLGDLKKRLRAKR